MRILITTTQVPFIRGGAEAHAEGLRDALRAAGHEAEIVAVPFKWYPPEKILDHLLACRLLDLTEVAGVKVDRVIGLKFPAYLIPHPNKVVWILHQHRSAYELWEHAQLGDLIFEPRGREVRAAIERADINLLPEAKALFANSQNVAKRLKQFCNLDAAPLYHPPPNAEKFYTAEAEDYLFYPSRLCVPKRQALVLRALAETRAPVRVVFAGAADDPAFAVKLQTLARELNLENRVQWLGMISEEAKRELYARARGVVYTPVDEDYGYVTLEAMLAAKPVVTCSDAGGVLEFVRDRENGLIVAPDDAQALAAALDEIWERKTQAQNWGAAGRAFYDAQNITWENVIKRLLA